MLAYKEWGHQLYPALAFEDLANRTDKLGGKARVRELMRELREQERDRYTQSKYGSSAVDEVGGQEPAESTGENVGGVDEREGERHDPPRNGRYTDVSEDRDRAQQTVGSGGSGGSGGRDTVTSTSRSATVLSPEIRQRMEANRRLALERLRMKKQEAVTEAAGARVATPASDRTPEGAPLDDAATVSSNRDPGEEGVPRGVLRNRESNDAADLQEAHSPAKRAKVSTGDAPHAQPSAATSHHPVSDSALSSRDTPVSASTSQETEQGSRERSSSSGEGVPGATLPTQAPSGQGIERGEGDACPPAGQGGPIAERDDGSLRTSPPSSTEAHGDVAAHDRDAAGAAVGRDAEEGATSSTSPRPPTPTNRGEAAAGGVAPLSPLGRMLAATDEAAEGQSMGTRLPLDDLFPGET